MNSNIAEHTGKVVGDEAKLSLGEKLRSILLEQPLNPLVELKFKPFKPERKEKVYGDV